jgi:molecular chaperone DnaK (HSP70)
MQMSSASLFGLDIGGEYSKACYLSSSSKNIFQIVENSSGKRKTPTGVGYYQDKRTFEREISNRKNRNPDQVV